MEMAAIAGYPGWRNPVTLKKACLVSIVLLARGPASPQSSTSSISHLSISLDLPSRAILGGTSSPEPASYPSAEHMPFLLFNQHMQDSSIPPDEGGFG